MATEIAAVCGTGGWVGPLPGDPDNNVTLTATPAFGGIDVAWTYPLTNPEAVAHTILWRSVNSNFVGAIKRAVVNGNTFYDKVPAHIPYYYWINIVSVHGTVGAVVGPAISEGRPLIADLITELSGQIDSGMLATTLRTAIQQIPLLDGKINKEVSDRQLEATATAVFLAQVQASSDQVATFLQTEITRSVSADAALVTAIDAVGVQFQSNSAAIVTERNLRAAADVAEAALRTTLEAQVNNVTTGLPATRASLINDYYTKVGTDAVIATSATQLRAYQDGATAAMGAKVDTLETTKIGYCSIAGVASDHTNKTLCVAAGGVWSVGLPLATAVKQVSVSGANGGVASLESSMTAQQTLNTSFKAQYTMKLTVNGLIGGFGLYNSGINVLAGFDVDTFYVGRTNANMRKPFIISNNETIIDEAVIKSLTFSKLRDEAGTFIVENGKVKATYLTVVNSIMGGSYTGWGWPANGGAGFYIGPEGLLLGNYNTGKYFQVTSDGNLYAPGFKVINGALTINQVNVIGTSNIANNAVTSQASAYSAGDLYVGGAIGQQAIQVQVIGISTSGANVFLCCNMAVTSTDPNNAYPGFATIYRNGVEIVRNSANINGYDSVLAFTDNPPAGYHTYASVLLISSEYASSVKRRSMFALETKR